MSHRDLYRLIDKEQMFGDRVIEKDDRKWAIIDILGERHTVPVDNHTMKAYETDGYSWTDKEIENFTFVRWARPLDL